MQNLAQSVATMMKNDQVKPEQVTVELVLAYAEAYAKKIVSIQNLYLTNQEFKKNFQLFILNQLGFHQTKNSG